MIFLKYLYNWEAKTENNCMLFYQYINEIRGSRWPIMDRPWRNWQEWSFIIMIIYYLCSRVLYFMQLLTIYCNKWKLNCVVAEWVLIEWTVTTDICIWEPCKARTICVSNTICYCMIWIPPLTPVYYSNF